MGYMALKLDTRKVYDWVEWVFLEKIMLKLGLVQDGLTLFWPASSKSPIPLCWMDSLKALLFQKGAFTKAISYLLTSSY